MRYTRRVVRGPESGFTLVEILVVVAIIAILATVVALKFNFKTGDDVLREEVRRFDVRLHLAAEQALIEGRSIGVQVQRNGYGFHVYEPLDQQWYSMDADRIFKQRSLPEGVTFELFMEDQDIEIPTAEESEDDVAPQILLLSSGDVTPFSVYVDHEDTDVDFELIVDPSGDSQIVEHDRGF